MNDYNSPNRSPILLGRIFLSTTSTTIDGSKGSLMMEFDGQIVLFNIFYAKEHPTMSHSAFAINMINPVVHDIFELNGKDNLEIVLTKFREQLSEEFNPLSIQFKSSPSQKSNIICVFKNHSIYEGY